MSSHSVASGPTHWVPAMWREGVGNQGDAKMINRWVQPTITIMSTDAPPVPDGDIIQDDVNVFDSGTAATVMLIICLHNLVTPTGTPNLIVETIDDPNGLEWTTLWSSVTRGQASLDYSYFLSLNRSRDGVKRYIRWRITDLPTTGNAAFSFDILATLY